MAIAKVVLRMMPNVHRPAIAASWPTPDGYCVVLDVGANVDCAPRQLVEFAIMGEAFHRAVHGAARPSVGLLNVGTEELKGNEIVRAAAQLIKDADLDMNYAGFVEGDDISLGRVDVVVTDGFTGNVALKTAEGTAKLVAGFLREALKSDPLAMAGAVLSRGALKRLKDRMDPRSVNGGVFLGLNGAVVKSHGGTDGVGFATALRIAVEMARSNFRDEVGRNLQRLADQPDRSDVAEARPQTVGAAS
jgi:glycerol-3-phosphate acyltransferase PlsX